VSSNRLELGRFWAPVQVLLCQASCRLWQIKIAMRSPTSCANVKTR
jgi:hypothetical protein